MASALVAMHPASQHLGSARMSTSQVAMARGGSGGNFSFVFYKKRAKREVKMKELETEAVWPKVMKPE